MLGVSLCPELPPTIVAPSERESNRPTIEPRRYLPRGGLSMCVSSATSFEENPVLGCYHLIRAGFVLQVRPRQGGGAAGVAARARGSHGEGGGGESRGEVSD